MLKKLNAHRQQYKILKPYYRSFGFKIFVFIGIMLILLLGANIWYNIYVQEQQLVEEVLLWANNVAQTVKYSTKIHMLENKKEKVQETINYIVETTPGIERIRILDKKGKIRKTTVQGERGKTIDKRSHCSLCHASGVPLDTPKEYKHIRILQPKKDGYRTASLTHTIYNEESCATRCHKNHPEPQKVLGVFEVTMSLKDVDKKIAANTRRLIHISLGSFLFILTNLGIMLFYFLIRPVNALLNGVRSLSLGNFEAKIPVYSHDELGRLSESFNNMVKKLSKEMGYRKLLLYDSAMPEQKEEAMKTKNNGTNTGANTEANTGQNTIGSSFEEIYEQIRDQTHMKLVRSVKLASLGQLSAGIAHEINNPLTAVLSYSSLLLEKAKTPKEKRWLTIIVDETKRCRNIVSGLLDFARKSSLEKISTQVNDIVERAISLMENKESFHNIRIIKHLSKDLPKVKLDSGQIYQVITNLIINAADAMEGQGTLTVKSKVHTIESNIADDRHFVEVSVIDTGCGIPQQNMERLFDPFFTTKGPTVGTGLGLSICFGIIKRHGGNISVQSKVGEGSTFIIHLPFEKENHNGQED